MGSVVIDIEDYGSQGGARLKAMVDTGFYRDMIPPRPKGRGFQL
jgi:hypothetical protein